jgi:hypothetical protein
MPARAGFGHGFRLAELADRMVVRGTLYCSSISIV